MRKIVLACAMAASLAGCSSWHHERGYESSGTTAPPTQLQNSSPAASGATQNPSSQNKTDWGDCEQHPYTPGPKACE